MRNRKKWCALALILCMTISGGVACNHSQTENKQAKANVIGAQDENKTSELEAAEDTAKEEENADIKEEAKGKEKENVSEAKSNDPQKSAGVKNVSSTKQGANGQKVASSNSNASKKQDSSSNPSKTDTQKPSKPDTSKPSKPDTSKPSKPGHQHSWVAQKKTINHPEKGHNEKVLVKEAWTEKIPRYKDIAVEICNTCGAEITGNVSAHVKKHMMAGEDKGGSRTEYKSVFSHYEYVEHPAQYSTKYVVDEKAWTETVVTGYKCSCGATK